MTNSSAPISGPANPSRVLPEAPALSFRDRALLGAVAEGRCHIELGPLPRLTVDHRGACDQLAAHQLLAGGLIEAGPTGRDGRIPARLSETGHAALLIPWPRGQAGTWPRGQARAGDGGRG